MKALLLDHATGHQDLYLGVLPTPVPQAGELLVQVQAVGLNPVDYKLAAMGWPTWTYPHVLGLDVAGVVTEIGAGVTDFQIGDRVFYHGNLRKQGGFAEFATTVAHVVSPIPEGMTFETAAALPCAGFTAWHALHERLHIEQGQTVLIQGAAGGVGGFAVQLAHLAGCRVIATCSSGNIDFVRGFGADEIIYYRI
jgi:NADPH:quinone reductase